MSGTDTQRSELKERLILDGIQLSIRPWDLPLTGYKIEPIELKAKTAYGDCTFKFIIRGTRIDKIAESYTMAFFYKTKGYNVTIQNCIQDFFNPQMTLGTPEDRYQGLKDDIQRCHYEYKKDSKDVDIFVLDFQTSKMEYGEDREGTEFTTIEGIVSTTQLVELIKRRQSMDERMVVLIEDHEIDLLEGIDKVVQYTKDRNAEIEYSRRDPAKELEKYLTEIRDRSGKDYAHKIFTAALDELVGSKKNDAGDTFYLRGEKVTEEEFLKDAPAGVAEIVAKVNKKRGQPPLKK